MTEKEKKARAAYVVAELEKIYPDAACALESGGDPWRLLVMGRLSAQCTDARVNTVCRELFAHFPDAAAMAAAPLEEIEKLVYSCGVYKVKAKNIRDFSAIITEKYGGRVPDSMEELLTLPGVGRKIANLILGDVYGNPAIVADTHCIRITRRLGFHDLKDAAKIEKILRQVLPQKESNNFCHRLVLHGRAVCKAGKPQCEKCCMSSFCKFKKDN